MGWRLGISIFGLCFAGMVYLSMLRFDSGGTFDRCSIGPVVERSGEDLQ